MSSHPRLLNPEALGTLLGTLLEPIERSALECFAGRTAIALGRFARRCGPELAAAHFPLILAQLSATDALPEIEDTAAALLDGVRVEIARLPPAPAHLKWDVLCSLDDTLSIVVCLRLLLQSVEPAAAETMEALHQTLFAEIEAACGAVTERDASFVAALRGSPNRACLARLRATEHTGGLALFDAVLGLPIEATRAKAPQAFIWVRDALFLLASIILSVAAAGAVVWMLLVVATPTSRRYMLAALVYCSGFVAVSVCSAFQYFTQNEQGGEQGERWRDRNRASIFALICGTQLFDFSRRYTDARAHVPLLALALAVVAYRFAKAWLGRDSIWFRRFRSLLYLAQAWAPFYFWDLKLMDWSGRAWLLLFGGGVAYSVSALLYLWDRARGPVGPAGLWYYSVILGWITHYLFVLTTLRNDWQPAIVVGGMLFGLGGLALAMKWAKLTSAITGFVSRAMQRSRANPHADDVPRALASVR